MTKQGIHLHVTAGGKLLCVVRKDGESITFELSLREAETLQREVQSIVDELKNELEGRA